MAHIEDSHSRDRGRAPEIPASITSGSSHNLDMTDQGEMTEVMIDHNHRTTERELHRLFRNISDVTVAIITR